MTIRTRYWSDIQTAAGLFKLDPILVEAVVVQESSGNTDAFRWEPDFWNRYLKLKPEWKDWNPRRASSSYGLLQIMYPVALERGYPSNLPPEMLFCPDLGLRWGCAQLAYLQAWADTGWPEIPTETRRLATIASYNGGRGGNTPDSPLRPVSGAYAKSVMKYYSLLQDEHK